MSGLSLNPSLPNVYHVAGFSDSMLLAAGRHTNVTTSHPMSKDMEMATLQRGRMQ